jgi:small subunit ribosomal protein S6
MTAYDLFVLLDPSVEEERRAGIVSRLREQIEAGGGAIKGDADWGLRKLAYEIDHKPEAQYHLFQIEASPDLIKNIEHSLSIDDAVMRHRVIRLPKGAPAETPKPAPASAAPPVGAGEESGRPRPRRGEGGGRREP